MHHCWGRQNCTQDMSLAEVASVGWAVVVVLVLGLLVDSLINTLMGLEEEMR